MNYARKLRQRERQGVFYKAPRKHRDWEENFYAPQPRYEPQPRYGPQPRSQPHSELNLRYESEQHYEPLHEKDEEQLTQRLYGLNKSSAQFLKQLDELLQDEKWMRGTRRLSQDKLVGLIDCLDNIRLISVPSKSCSSSLQIINGLDRTGSQFREGLHLLRELCSSRATLPTTYLVSGKLSFSRPRMGIPGGYGDRYKGSIGAAGVCIKTPWAMLNLNLRANIERVSHPQSLARLPRPDDF